MSTAPCDDCGRRVPVPDDWPVDYAYCGCDTRPWPIRCPRCGHFDTIYRAGGTYRCIPCAVPFRVPR